MGTVFLYIAMALAILWLAAMLKQHGHLGDE